MLNSRFKSRLIVFTCAFWAWSLAFAFAIEDGFGSAKKLESKHFTIYYSAQLDMDSLAKTLDLQVSDEVLAGNP